MNELQHCYVVLSLEPGSPLAEVLKRHRKIVKAFHPDRYPDPNEKAEAEEELKQFNNARDKIRQHINSQQHHAQGPCECRLTQPEGEARRWTAHADQKERQRQQEAEREEGEARARAKAHSAEAERRARDKTEQEERESRAQEAERARAKEAAHRQAAEALSKVEEDRLKAEEVNRLRAARARRIALLRQSMLIVGGLGLLVYFRAMGPAAPDSGSGATPEFEILEGGERVRALKTGLIWQREAPTSYPSATSSYGSLMSWRDAQLYCTSLGLAGGGWRLPTKDELLSLLDAHHYPTHSGLDPRAFPHDQPGEFWSATPIPARAGQEWAWVVLFNHSVPSSMETPVEHLKDLRCVSEGSGTTSARTARPSSSHVSTAADPSQSELSWVNKAQAAPIIPGVGLAGIKIGDRKESVIGVLGVPTMGIPTGLLYRRDRAILVAELRDGHVSQLALVDENLHIGLFLKLPGDLSLSMDPALVPSRFGKPRKHLAKSKTMTAWCDQSRSEVLQVWTYRGFNARICQKRIQGVIIPAQ